MHWYQIDQFLLPLESKPVAEIPAIVLLTSEELSQRPVISGWGDILCHVSPARDARLCKAEVHANCLSGTLALPCPAKSVSRQRYAYAISKKQVVLVDDTERLSSCLQHLIDDRLQLEGHIGIFFYELLESIRAGDLNHLEVLGNRIGTLEENVLSDRMDGFSVAMTSLRKETMAWFRYYVQLDDMVCELQENENGFFTSEDLSRFHLLEERCSRLREEAQLLREYCMQVQGMFQAEIGIRQNQIMKILTIVTTIFLPLSLLVGWYGMNFAGMPELKWKYGYPAIIAVSILIVLASLWICKKKRFW